MKDITDVWYQLRNERRLKKDCTDSSATELGTDQGRERGVRRREEKGEKRELGGKYSMLWLKWFVHHNK
jgi:hypothetical protein